MNATKKNNPSIETKGKTKPILEQEDMSMLNDPYYLDPQLKAELKTKGLVGRFVNVTRMKQLGGRHQKGWIPYKRESQMTDMFGADPEGYVRRGADLVLAVKTVEQVAKHKKMLRLEAESVKVHNMIRRNKERLKREMRDAGVDKHIKVIDDE